MYFGNDGNPKVYLTSSDLMPRCLDSRIELCWPIENEKHKEYLINILSCQLFDNCFSTGLQSNGKWLALNSSGESFDSEVKITELEEIRRKQLIVKSKQRGSETDQLFHIN